MKHIVFSSSSFKPTVIWLAAFYKQKFGTAGVSVFEAELIRSALAVIFAGSYSTLRSSFVLLEFMLYGEGC